MSKFSCPNAHPGSWRSCPGGSEFVGCCRIDPCDYGCDSENLLPAAFNPAISGTVPELECEPSAKFYVCPDTIPPFFGCCKTDACGQADGCPRAQLSPATLGSNTQAVAFFSPTGQPSSTAVPNSPKGSSVGVAVGGAVGGTLLIVLLVSFLWWRRRRSRRQQAKSPDSRLSATMGPNRPPIASGWTADYGPAELSVVQFSTSAGELHPLKK